MIIASCLLALAWSAPVALSSVFPAGLWPVKDYVAIHWADQAQLRNGLQSGEILAVKLENRHSNLHTFPWLFVDGSDNRVIARGVAVVRPGEDILISLPRPRFIADELVFFELQNLSQSISANRKS